MDGKSSLTLTSMLFVFATLAGCNGGGNGGGGVTPTPNPAPGPTPTPNPSPGPQASAIAVPKTGQTVCYDPNGTAAEVACANTGEDGEYQTGVAAPNPRFTVDNTGDCVTDNLTGLMWTRNGNLLAGQRTWQQALDYSNNLELCGFSDWRLPNRNELRSFINHQTNINALALNDQGFNNVALDSAYWSSTSYSYAGGATHAWMVSMALGIVGQANKSNSGYVWPVRAGQ